MPSKSDEHVDFTADLENWYIGRKLNSLLADLCWNVQMKFEDDEYED